MQDEATMLTTIENVTPLLGGMDRDKLVQIWQHTVGAQAQSKDAVFLVASEQFLDAIDAEFASERLKGDYLKEGPLAFFGYHVGRRADLPAKKRQAILSAIYRRSMSRVFPENYTTGWGDPETPQRLERIAWAIASFIRDPRRRKDPRMEDAIAEWKEDLAYLRQTYFWEGSSWPTI